MTWRWNACSMRLTPMRPSRTSSEDRRLEPLIVAPLARSSRRLYHVGAGEPIVQAALLPIEPDPQEAERERGGGGEIPQRAQEHARHRGRAPVDVDDAQAEDAHPQRPS